MNTYTHDTNQNSLSLWKKNLKSDSKTKRMHVHTDEDTDFSKTEEIFQLYDHICGQSKMQRLIPTLNNNGT